MSRSFFTLLRLCTGRKLVWAFLACFALLFYELVQLMLTAYGNAGQVEIMGIDLPPLVLAAEAFGRSAAPWLIVPFVVCAYAEEHLANGYVVMIQSNGEDAKVLALKFIGSVTTNG